MNARTQETVEQVDDYFMGWKSRTVTLDITNEAAFEKAFIAIQDQYNNVGMRDRCELF